jgi:hypothetical protein
MAAVLPEYTGIGDSQTTESELIENTLDFFHTQSPRPEHIIGKHQEHIPPSSDLDLEYTPVQFEIKNYGPHYIDLGKTRLIGSFKVVKEDGTDLGDNDDVAIINNFAHAMWSSIDLVSNGSLQVELSTNRYGYKSYFEHLLSYNKYCEGHTKALSLWSMDTAGKYEKCDDSNEGYKHRKAIISKSKSVEFVIPLLTDFFSLNKMWPNNTSIILRMTRNSSDFLLMAAAASSTNKYKIKFNRLILEIHKCTLAPKLNAAIELQLLSKNMIYSYDKCKILEFAIKQNQILIDFNDIHNGLIPKYLLISMVRTSALSGVITENPWTFEHNKITRLYAKVNGHVVPSYPYEFDFNKTPAVCIRAFASLYDEIGINRAAREHYIDKYQFVGGSFVMPFSFCADSCFGRVQHPNSYGQISLHMQLATGLTHSSSLLVFMVYDEEFHLDAGRQITFPRIGQQIP